MPYVDKTLRVDFRTARAMLAGRSAGPLPPPATPAQEARRKPDGSAAERALWALLERLGCADVGIPGSRPFGAAWWIRQYPWGAYLTPSRKFQADAGFPMLGILVEVEGKAHDLKRKGDVVRRQLAEAAGWRVVAILPEQIRNGEAERILRTRIDQEVTDV